MVAMDSQKQRLDSADRRISGDAGIVLLWQGAENTRAGANSRPQALKRNQILDDSAAPLKVVPLHFVADKFHQSSRGVSCALKEFDATLNKTVGGNLPARRAYEQGRAGVAVGGNPGHI